ncbi:hypothetical protein [Planctomicrobium sp. SH527]|uniref:hypothetical protein n=1 Tax=Planctomicrobium sp. SH527 TaxID=3448123 RepID=UPI003F5C9011
MKRRRSPPANSLDLLLDTICNTFGGIIFIALLVVLLLLISGNPEAAPSPAQEAEVLAISHQLATDSELKLRLQSSLEKQMGTISKLTSDDLKETLGNYQEEINRNASLKTSLAGVHKKLQVIAQHAQEMSQERKDHQSRLNTIQLQIEDLKKTLFTQRDSRRKTLEMPIVRTAGLKRQIIIVLQYNRLYIWHRYSSDGTREGLNTDDFLILSNETRGSITTPNPVAGIPLNQTEESKRQIVQKLSRFRPGQNYLAVIVRPDSYGSFQHLREIFTTLNLEYDLQPSTRDAEWFDRGGTDGFVQ